MAGPSRQSRVAAVLLGIGGASVVMIYAIHRDRARNMVPRPEAEGDVGTLTVNAQLPDRLLELAPESVVRLPRPQDLAFQFTARGSGPRRVRVEEEDGDGRRTVLHEEAVLAPADRESLGFLVHLDQSTPDTLKLVTTVEAPHAHAVVAKYGLRLYKSGDTPP
jgi:hypothetical protein